MTPRVLLALLLGPALLRADESSAPPLLIAHATVIDGTGAPPRPDTTVVVRDGRIAAIGKDGEVEAPERARVVDAAGKYLIPGLWDMHVHFSDRGSMPLFLANGVTGVRVMWGNASFGIPLGPYHYNWRKQVAAGTLLGPRLVVASNILDGPKPIWPGSVALAEADAARKAVRDAKKAGADFIKVYSLLPREAYFAIADEAKAQDLPFAGHVPFSVSAREASDAGQKSLEHLYGVLAACSSEEEAITRERAEAMKALKNPTEIRGVMTRFERRVAASYDESKAAALFGRFKKNGTWQCPTLTVHRAIASLDDPTFVADPRLKYLPPFIRSFWDPKNDFRFKSMTPEDFAALKAAYRRAKQLVAAMNKAGVGFLAGTDELNPYCFPGFSLHDELALLVESGLSPMEAIQAATRNPARFLGLEATAGTVAAGRDADLVLLDADPLADIRNTTKIRAVVRRGRFFDRDALDRMLSDAEAAAAGKKTTTPGPGGILPAGYCPEH
jgi:imidazolonepropionase-like amidohydrolase